MLLTEQEMTAFFPFGLSLYASDIRLVRAIESAVIEKITAQGAVAWLHRDRPESDVVTTKVKHVWGKAAVGSLALYDIPLYRLPEREKEWAMEWGASAPPGTSMNSKCNHEK